MFFTYRWLSTPLGITLETSGRCEKPAGRDLLSLRSLPDSLLYTSCELKLANDFNNRIIRLLDQQESQIETNQKENWRQGSGMIQRAQ